MIWVSMMLKKIFNKNLTDYSTRKYNVYKRTSSSEPCCSGNHDGVEEIEFKVYSSKLRRLAKMVQIRKALNQAEITNEVDKYLEDPFVKWTKSFNI